MTKTNSNTNEEDVNTQDTSIPAEPADDHLQTSQDTQETQGTQETPEEDIRSERDKYFSLLQQNQAEFENFKKRTRRERQEWKTLDQAQVLVAMLPILDNFDRALHAHQSNQDLQSFFDGTQLIYQQLQEFLTAQQVKKIPAEPGTPFNPELHQAMFQEPTTDFEPGTISQTTLHGYQLRDHVIRHSQVAVAAVPSTETNDTAAEAGSDASTSDVADKD